MKRTLAIATAFGALLGTTGLALAQNATYPGYNNGYYPPPNQTAPTTTVAPPAATGSTWGSPAVSTDAHTGGGASRAYPGGLKTN
jgi:hypothetical protein